MELFMLKDWKYVKVEWKFIVKTREYIDDWWDSFLASEYVELEDLSKEMEHRLYTEITIDDKVNWIDWIDIHNYFRDKDVTD